MRDLAALIVAVIGFYLLSLAVTSSRPTAEYAQPGCASVVDLSMSGLSIAPDCTAAQLATQRYMAEQRETTARAVAAEREATERTRVMWPWLTAISMVVAAAVALVVVAYLLRPRPAPDPAPTYILIAAAPYLAQGWTLDTHPDTGHWIAVDDDTGKYIDVQSTALARRT